MSLTNTIRNDLTNALKAHQSQTVTTLRLALAALKNEQIAKQTELSDDQTRSVIWRLVREREEAIVLYQQAGRNEQAEKETLEVATLKQYLPDELTEAELKLIINDAIIQTGAHSVNDFGKVMKLVMGRTKGRVTGKMVSDLTRRILS